MTNTRTNNEKEKLAELFSSLTKLTYDIIDYSQVIPEHKQERLELSARFCSSPDSENIDGFDIYAWMFPNCTIKID